MVINFIKLFNLIDQASRAALLVVFVLNKSIKKLYVFAPSYHSTNMCCVSVNKKDAFSFFFLFSFLQKL